MRMISILVALSIAVLQSAGSIPFSDGVTAQGTVGRTSLVVRGMRITLVVPLVGSLPRSALLRVQVQVTNLSGHNLTLPRTCDRANPRAVVSNRSGSIVYTTIRTFPVAQRCIKNPPLELEPGRSVQRQNYVVLRGPIVQPVVYLRAGDSTNRVAGKGYFLNVRARYLTPYATALFADGSRRLIAGGRGNVPLYKARRIVAIEVTARRPVLGPLVAVGSALCPGHRILLPQWTVISRANPVARIPAPCSRPRLWGLDYGWVGQSIAEVLVGTGNLIPTVR
jgi:hypothetical protein